MEFLEALKTLVEYGIAFAVMGAVIVAFLLDKLAPAAARDREVNRERALTDRAMEQVTKLVEELKATNDAWERRNEIDAARYDIRNEQGR
jgi:hypothetical protein